jgi:hypothetical protein
MEESAEQTELETNLKAILGELNSHTWTIQTLFQALKGRGYPFLIVLMSLPFCQPLQIPGFSTPFGVILMFVGLRMSCGKYIWWPKWVLNQEISPRLLKSVIKKSLWFIHYLKRVLHSRWRFFCQDSRFYRLHGGFVALMGLYLALPLPIPFSNLLAAWALLFIGLGLMEDDGLFVCLSYLIGSTGILMLGFLLTWLGEWMAS